MDGWCRTLAGRLHIDSSGKKLLIDKTGVLFDERFVDYLLDQNHNFQIARDSIQVALAAQANPDIILAPPVNVPSSVKKNRDVYILDFNNLPIEIEPSIASGLSADKLISLIAFHINNPDGILISRENLNQKLHDSAVYHSRASIKSISKKIRLLAYHIEDYVSIIQLGQFWGEYLYLCFLLGETADQELQQMVDDGIRQAVIENGRLKKSFYESETELRSVDKIRAYLAGVKCQSKIALVCFDGMGVVEWHVLRNYLKPWGFSYTEKFMLSLIPTITKIARSAIYYGDHQKVYSLKSPNEQKQFESFFSPWICRFFREGDIRNEDNLLGVDVASVIYNVFDDIGHSTQLPDGNMMKALYFENILNYLEKSKVGEELLLLKNLGYKIFLCSDHGCVVAHGNGQKIDKYLVEEGSKRATLIEATQLSEFYDVDHYEIPFVKNKVALLAKERTIFASKKVREISHGGITAEELVVPFVEVIA